MRILLLAIILIGLAIAGMLAWRTAPDRAEAREAALAAARARWQTQSPDAYKLRMRYEVDSPFHNEQCGIELAVRGEAIEILNNSCAAPMTWTIEQLFASAELPTIRTCYPAGSGGCACISSFEVKARFDSETGHPTEINRQSMISVQWLSSELWQQFVRKGKLPWCVRSAGASSRTVVIEEVVPLP